MKEKEYNHKIEKIRINKWKKFINIINKKIIYKIKDYIINIFILIFIFIFIFIFNINMIINKEKINYISKNIFPKIIINISQEYSKNEIFNKNIL